MMKLKILTEKKIIAVCGKAWDEGLFGGPFPDEVLVLAIPMLEVQLKQTVRDIVKWGNTFCVAIEHYGLDKRANTRKRECRECWQELQQQGG